VHNGSDDGEELLAGAEHVQREMVAKDGSIYDIVITN